jgi:hypothetical protein
MKNVFSQSLKTQGKILLSEHLPVILLYALVTLKRKSRINPKTHPRNSRTFSMKIFRTCLVFVQ